LLVIDDISYVRRSELETSVLFELISHRYERKSLLMTSNQPFREWDEIFPSGSMTVAAVDHLVHHWLIIGIKGRELSAKACRCTGFQRSKRPAYVIDAGRMAITINDTTTPTHQNHGSDTKTELPALKLTPETQLD